MPVPHLNKLGIYEEINCDGFDMDGNLRIHDMPECAGTYECVPWKDEPVGSLGTVGKWVESTCEIKPELFSHCSQCNICVSNRDNQVQVQNFIYLKGFRSFSLA